MSSALETALAAAQAKAVGALEKAYVAGQLSSEGLASRLAEIGCPDAVDGAHLLAALDVLREYGAAAPAAPGGSYAERNATRPATDAQRAFITRLADEKEVSPPDLSGLTREKASELIDQLRTGSYSAADWDIPFMPTIDGVS
ncbi:MAG TPA: hypothetical protein VH279_07195 [Solirubrobacteraceae bacterium]|jgi:hypothetical protein|nr:hypothetical protein [Solirubrobacteraceae bacterium]